MKKNYLFVALAAMGVAASCSNDELVGVKPGNVIDFSVTANKQTRAAATTTNTISGFKIWALVDNGGSVKVPYMNETGVTRGGDGKWTYEGTKFWPESPLDFYAVSPATVSGVTVGIAQTIAYTVVDGSEDLLYSTALEQKKADHISAPVAINFRHALSQIVFRAKLTENSTISVKIKGIKVDGVANAGTFAWATETTDYTDENDTETGASWGKWNVGTDVVSYDVNLDGEYDLSADVTSFDDNSLFLMPQKLNPWLTGEGYEAVVTGTARVLVDCQIIDNNSHVQLWPAADKTEGWVAVSLNNPANDPNRGDTPESQAKHDKWMQGKKYIYTLIFGKQGAGYEPEPEDPDKDPDTDPDPKPKPKPVLVPIKFEVSVDAFQNGGEYDASGKTE